jgi:chemotaxis protein CheD
MTKTIGHREVFVNPGEFFFGEGNIRITTILGSCVSITMWHPSLKHGGICHYILDSRGVIVDHLNGKYADEAMELFRLELKKRKTDPADYQVKVFGGGNMFGKDQSGGGEIGQQNIEAAHRLLRRDGFSIAAENVGGFGHRRLMFDLWNGDVWMRFRESRNNEREMS